MDSLLANIWRECLAESDVLVSCHCHFAGYLIWEMAVEAVTRQGDVHWGALVLFNRVITVTTPIEMQAQVLLHPTLAPTQVWRQR
jgi:hypothetical protein